MIRYPLEEYLPHRKPMLLIEELVEVSMSASSSHICISEQSSFFQPGLGVPAWIGVEYMGQTAACIAGFQLKQGCVDPHIGLLLGSRKYESFTDWFHPGQLLAVSCSEHSTVGGELANFQCEIHDRTHKKTLAVAKLTVMRQPIKTGN